MLKSDELADPNSCFNRAKPDEFVFVLLERDETAADAISYWVSRRIATGKNLPSDPQILSAIEQVKAMKERKMEKDNAGGCI